MLEFDQWDGLSVDNNSTSHPVNDGDDASVIALASDAGQRRPHPHPLRRPYLPIPLNTDFRSSGPSEFGETFEVGETRPRLAHLLNRSSLNDGESITADDSDTGSAEDEEDEATPIVHKVGPSDSLPRVALRYGISIAVLRRANQLWPSDPIHLRTELKIPRGDPIPARPRLAGPSQSHVERIDHVAEAPSRSSSDTFASALSIHEAIISALPTRISLDSLSSRTTSSETHELDDLRALRSRRLLTGPGTSDVYELPVLGNLNKSTFPPAPTTRRPLPCVGISEADLASENPSRHGHPPRSMEPSVFIPVRISQLEPEPQMEFPLRPRAGS